MFFSFVLTSPTSGKLSTGFSQDHSTVQPRLEGGTPRSTNIATQCPSTAKDSALLRYLLFSNKDFAVKNSATSPLFNTNPNLNPNPTSSAFPLLGPGKPKLRHSIPVGSVGPPKANINNSANAGFQLTPNTQVVPPTTVQKLTSRISELEKLFADEIATYTSITAGIHSQYFVLDEKIRQIEPGKSDVIIWKIPSVKFVIDSAKLVRRSFDLLHDSATSFSSPTFRSHGYKFFIKFYPYGIGPATGKCASIMVIKTRPTRSPQCQQKQELQQSSSTTLFFTPNSLAKLKVFLLMMRAL